MIKTASSKYIPLTIISVMANFGPPITVGMAFCFLNERLRLFETGIMFF
jgi:hypothetical protein